MVIWKKFMENKKGIDNNYNWIVLLMARLLITNNHLSLVEVKLSLTIKSEWCKRSMFSAFYNKLFIKEASLEKIVVIARRLSVGSEKAFAIVKKRIIWLEMWQHLFISFFISHITILIENKIFEDFSKRILKA